MSQNPLLLPFDAAPFSNIKNEHFIPAFDELITNAKVCIQAISQNTDKPTFENTIAALEYSSQQLSRVSSIFFNLNSAQTSDEIQKIAQEVSPKLTTFGNDITLNELLFKRVKVVYDQRESLDLSDEAQMLLKKHYLSFSRNGALLNPRQKEQLRTIDNELSQQKLKFGEHVLADTQDFQMLITNIEDLEGLPDSALSAAKILANSKDQEGWLFTLDYPSYIPFMKYVKSRELRKKLALAFGAKGFQNNENNNEAIVKRIVTLRHERALLLGYASHADFTLEQRMAGSSKAVFEFLNDLKVKAYPAAQKEFETLTAFAKDLDGLEVLEKWDISYYSEKLKQATFDLNDEVLKPYFSLEKVLNGAFEVATRLFDLKFEKTTEIDVYHSEVSVYRVTDQASNFLAYLYTDFHPRSGKRAGAWMTSFKGQCQKEGVNHRPHISIVCNFTRPTEDTPALLTFGEVTTLFHEFGHALHGMLANTKYPSLSGTHVFWDFVELPSQVMENWCYQKEALELFAYHYNNEELIPMDLIKKIKKAASFQEGMACLRQLSLGLLDMAWHSGLPDATLSVKDFERKQFKSLSFVADVPENCMSTAFSHIFQGGYAAGYYSYKWAEVLDADAFAYFEAEGIFNKKVATAFKTEVLEKGGTQSPEVLYQNFRGKKPDSIALLKRSGLL